MDVGTRRRGKPQNCVCLWGDKAQCYREIMNLSDTGKEVCWVYPGHARGQSRPEYVSVLGSGWAS